jgi:integrase
LPKLYLNDATVKALATDKPQEDFYDTVCPGLILRVGGTGTRTFFIRYRRGRQRRRFKLGRYPKVGLAQARGQARKFLARVELGEDPQKVRAEHRSAPTLEDLADRFLEEHASKRKPKTRNEYKRAWKRSILPRLGKLRVADVTVDDIADLHASLSETPYAANRVRAVLSKAFNLAEAWGWRPQGTNPTKYVERYPERPRQRYLKPDEFMRLGKVLREVEAAGEEHPSVVPVIRFIIFTGARRGEAMNLRWDQVFLDRGIISLNESKTGAKAIPISRAVREILSAQTRLPDNPYVFPGKKPGSSIVGVPKTWERIRAAADLDDVRLHDLRHSFATVGVGDAALSLHIVGGLLGHTQPITTYRYAHLAAHPLQAASESVGSRLADLLGEG